MIESHIKQHFYTPKEKKRGKCLKMAFSCSFLFVQDLCHSVYATVLEFLGRLKLQCLWFSHNSSIYHIIVPCESAVHEIPAHAFVALCIWMGLLNGFCCDPFGPSGMFWVSLNAWRCTDYMVLML